MMETVVLEARGEALGSTISQAVEKLRAGDVVALPSETVYGLAGDALNPTAVARIFEAKNRPRFDPLIVHVADRTMLERVAMLDDALALRLVGKYWPGPLTLILPKRDVVPDLVTSGSPLVAVRMPSHPVFREVLQAFGGPLAAPSANPFGRISPTTAEHVRRGLEGRISLILDGGNCGHGLESTIVYPKNGTLHLLRAGPISLEELAKIALVDDSRITGKEAAPGQLSAHYAPGKPLFIVDPGQEIPDRAEAGYLGLSQAGGGWGAVEILSLTGDMVEAAANFFASLHRLDGAPVTKIYAERIRTNGLGRALMDRLERAATR